MSEDEPRTWRWVDVDGVESIVDEWDLLASLSNGTLAPYTLVWRQGWGEWLPACKVAELANAIPKSQIEPAVEPKLDASAEEPPPAPVDKYHSYQAREAASKLLGKVGKTAPPPGLMPPLGPGGIPSIPGVPPPPAPARPAQPTLVDGAQLSSTATLRPPGAVPPPPRAIPQGSPQEPYPAPVPAPVSPMINVVESSGPVSDQPTNPRGAPVPLPSWSDDLDAEIRAGRAPAQQPPGPPRAGQKSGSFLWIGLGIFALLGLSAVTLAVVVTARSKSTDTAFPLGTGGTSASPGGTARAPLAACTLAKPAARLAASIHPPVTPIVVTLPDANKMAIGYASSDHEADGIVVSLETLAVERPFHEKTQQEVNGVVPITVEGGLGFEVDYDGGEIRSSRRLNTKPRLTIGWTDSGVARKVGSESPALIWPSASDKPTDPRIARLTDGFALTARRGGQGGQVIAGFVGPTGEKRSELVEISSKAQLGTPVIAASDNHVLIAFAGRPTNESYWTMQLATSNGPEPPRVAQTFATPPGGLGADAISPAVEGLSNGRWLLQWTEGPAGRRQVRLQTLGFDLVPVGDPLTLSPDEANAGQGVVKVRGETGLSLFLVKKGKTHELWGALLKCP